MPFDHSRKKKPSDRVAQLAVKVFVQQQQNIQLSLWQLSMVLQLSKSNGWLQNYVFPLTFWGFDCGLIVKRKKKQRYKSITINIILCLESQSEYHLITMIIPVADTSFQNASFVSFEVKAQATVEMHVASRPHSTDKKLGKQFLADYKAKLHFRF